MGQRSGVEGQPGGSPHYFVWGVSHQTAPLALRELWALDADEKQAALRALRDRFGGSVVALSTCNRTEFYFYHEEMPPLGALNELLSALKGRAVQADPAVFYCREGEAAVGHLLAVASGLDSQILGETEIQGQVRSDLMAAREAGTCGSDLGRLFDHALKVGKRVRSETRLSEGVLSAAQAGVLLATKVLGDLAGARALLIGSGEIGRLTARALLEKGVRSIRVTSRTEANARRLAGEFGAEVVPFEAVAAAIAGSDLVISSTSAPGYIVGPEALSPLVRGRSDRALVIIDLAVPRDVDPRVAEIENVFLHDLDDLEAVLARSRSQRLGEVPRAELIIEEESRKFLAQRSYRLEIEPLIRDLIERAESWQREEVGREADRIGDEARDAVREITRRLIRRLILFPVSRLKELRDRGDLSPEEMALIRTIFEVREDEGGAGRNEGQ